MLGVCYYPEQWPEAWWEDDARRMREVGIAWVRVAEFAWSKLEPARGRFTGDWLDRALDLLGRHGLKVVMSTPTATPPKWLVDERPDILAWDANERPRRFGSRRHYCFSSKAWTEETARICELVAARWGRHEAVQAWQLDNEFGCHDTVLSYSPDARAAFRVWLERRYGSVDALNEAWGNAFWAMEYGAFAEIDPPNLTVTEASPIHRLDWRRFSSDQVVAYTRLQTAIVRRHSPGRPISHNFMGVFTEFAHAPVAAELDFITWDSYPLGFTDQRMPWLTADERRAYARTGHPDISSFHHDLYRGIAQGGRWWVMEQQPGPVNWAAHNTAPLPGMVRLWTLEALAHGAEVVSYFRWRQAPSAQEQNHAGLNRPDRVLDQGGIEAAAVAAELPDLHLEAHGSLRAPVALVFDEQAHWALTIQPQGAGFDYFSLVFAFYSALRRRGLDVDIRRPDQPLDGYRLVVVPTLPILDEGFVERVARSGAVSLFGPRSGSRTAAHAIPRDLGPGALQALLPIKVARVEGLPPAVEDRIVWGNRTYTGRVWRERIETALKPLAVYDDGEGALYAHGRAHYLGAWPDPTMADDLVEHLLEKAEVPATVLPPHLRLRRRGGLTFAFNYGDAATPVPLPPGSTLLLGEAAVPPRGVTVWR
ncbi:MAG: beta-galactosidase [Geminicoccaceae bacterium]